MRFGCNEEKFDPENAVQDIRGRKHLVNVKNSKYSCFLSSLAFHYVRKKDATKYSAEYDKFISGLNLKKTGIDPYKPITLRQIKMLLQQNKKYLDRLQVNILGFKSDEIYKYEVNIGSRNDENCLNLLSIPLVDLDDSKKTEDHLVVISSLDNFLSSRYATGETYTYQKKKHCLGCLNAYGTDELLKKHR